MRKFFFVLLAFPLAGMGQSKTLVSTERVFPKADKVAEFEKALAGHAEKYHSGDTRWRVFDIMSGPDAHGYQVTEGPTTWTALDTRGHLSTEHTADWNKNVAPYLTDRASHTFATYVDSLSTVAAGEYSNKIIINRMFPKPGMMPRLIELVKLMKPVWQAGNETVVVYTAAFSGVPQVSTVTRLKGGLKELEDGFRKPFLERYEAQYGAGAWARYLEEYGNCVESQLSEMLFYRADLSSK